MHNDSFCDDPLHKIPEVAKIKVEYNIPIQNYNYHNERTQRSWWVA